MKRNTSKSLASERCIETTAAAWLAQQDDDLTPDQAAAFAHWRSLDPRHEAAVQRLEKTWSSLHQLRNFRPESRRHPDRDLLASRQKAPVFSHPILATTVALAASLILAFVWWAVGSSSSFNPTGMPIARGSPYLTYATAVGGYQRVTLSDGSVIELNASTEVGVNYTAKERRVNLLRGEANFIVAKNKQRPFWVEAGKISIRAVGTAFNVRLSSREVEVLVTEGKVAVKSPRERDLTTDNQASLVPDTLNSDAKNSCLVAGQRLVFSVEAVAPKIHIQSLPPDTIRDALGWQGARLHFVDTPLSEVAAQFNRRNQTQIEIADPSLAILPVDGSFRADNVETFVRLLESNGSLTAERVGNDRIVLHRAR